jgi:hypothetical protein
MTRQALLSICGVRVVSSAAGQEQRGNRDDQARSDEETDRRQQELDGLFAQFENYFPGVLMAVIKLTEAEG